MNYDITVPGTAQLLARDLLVHADNIAVEKAGKHHSWRISPSSLGDKCAAKLWYKWRWAALPDIRAKVARLFETGHKSEDKFVDTLRRMGWTVWDKDPAREARELMNPQWNVKDFHGHLSGYLDAIGAHPVYTKGLNVNLEFKTANEKNFRLFVSKGIRVQSPKYYTQCCIYMFYMQLPWTLFVIENKNTSEWHFEIVMSDDGHAREKLKLAETVINSPVRPARIAEQAAYHECKFCEFRGVCHNDEKPLVSCRSCVNCVAAEGGSFNCLVYGPIPGEVIPKACGNWTPIK